MEESMIRLEHVAKNYGAKQVLKDVTINVKKGDIYGLVGKNGAGKSTMFKVILGLSDFQGGKLELMGSEENLDVSRSRIGFLIGDETFGYMTAKENLEYYADLKKIPNAKEEIESALEIVGLKGVKTKVKGFSLGMHQRLGIANAILGNPDILILDEPTNGLDPQGIMDVRNTVKRLNEERGMTIIVSSHILGELQNTANRFGLLNNGVLVKEISQEDLLVDTNVSRIDVDKKELERALEVLSREGINVTVEEAEKKTLEDYYFSLIGGEHNE